MFEIARTPEEIEALMDEAQEVSFAAEDAGERDERADATYEALKWIGGQGDRPQFDAVNGENEPAVVREKKARPPR